MPASLTPSDSTELFVNIICGSLPTLKPLWDRWASGRAINPSKAYSYSGASSHKMQGSSKGSKPDSRGYSSKSAFSTKTESGHFDSTPGKAITVVHAFDVQSKKDSATSINEVV